MRIRYYMCYDDMRYNRHKLRPLMFVHVINIQLHLHIDHCSHYPFRLICDTIAFLLLILSLGCLMLTTWRQFWTLLIVCQCIHTHTPITSLNHKECGCYFCKGISLTSWDSTFNQEPFVSIFGRDCSDFRWLYWGCLWGCLLPIQRPMGKQKWLAGFWRCIWDALLQSNQRVGQKDCLGLSCGTITYNSVYSRGPMRRQWLENCVTGMEPWDN